MLDHRDVVGSPEPTRGESLWSRLPPGRRRMVTLGAALLATGAILAYGVAEIAGSRQQRALEDAVSLSAEMNLSATSTTPAGGRVDFYLTLENTGRLPVSVTAVEAIAPRLSITGRLTGREFPLRPIQPAEVARVPLSVVLDCRTDALVVRTGGLVAAVRASPSSGRSRSVDVRVSNSALVTDIADTLCAIDPSIRDDELDGPVTVS